MRFGIVLAGILCIGTAEASEQINGVEVFTQKESMGFFWKGGVVYTEDRFSGVRMIRATTPWSYNPLISIMKTESGGVSQITMFFSHSSKSWRYLKCESNYYLIDGKPFDVVGEYDGNVRSGGVSESFSVTLTRNDLNKLATATSFEYKFCNDEFAANDLILNLIKDFTKVVEYYETNRPQDSGKS
jgi:hypothetical protein